VTVKFLEPGKALRRGFTCQSHLASSAKYNQRHKKKLRGERGSGSCNIKNVAVVVAFDSLDQYTIKVREAESPID
jgi:hypothetical protein